MNPRRARLWASIATGLLSAAPVFADVAGAPPGSYDLSTIVGLYLGGLILLMVEFFLIPGFGVPGLLGFGLVGANLWMVHQAYGATVAWGLFAAQIPVSLVILLGAAKLMAKTGLTQALTLSTEISSKHAEAKSLDPDLWLDRQGVSQGALSPLGEVRIEGQVLAAKARAGLIRENSSIQVVGVEGDTLIVDAC